MIRHLLHTLKSRFAHKALVLMYHRVAKLESDVWRLAVNPLHFEQHLQVLKKRWAVVPLHKLATDLSNGTLKRNSIAITFDDGYADNFLVAKPLLEKHQLPATFFISSGNIGRQKEFWWDELEQIILFTEKLPRTLSIQIESERIYFDLNEACKLTETVRKKHCCWKAFEQGPPTLRCTLFLKLWELLKPLSHQQQQVYLAQLKSWAGISYTSRSLYQSISMDQLRELGQSKLFTIGAHTVSHPDLASLSATEQQDEILNNKAFLENATDTAVHVLAYPYGRYTSDTVEVLAKNNFKAAVTTDNKQVTSSSDKYRLGRFLVDDYNGEQFENNLSMWLQS